MSKIYVINGKNDTKEWPVVAYVDIYSAKQHFTKLEEHLKNNKELIEKGESPIPTKYDPSNNIATKYFVILTHAFMTFSGWKAYMQVDEYEVKEEEVNSEQIS